MWTVKPTNKKQRFLDSDSDDEVVDNLTPVGGSAENAGRDIAEQDNVGQIVSRHVSCCHFSKIINTNNRIYSNVALSNKAHLAAGGCLRANRWQRRSSTHVCCRIHNAVGGSSTLSLFVLISGRNASACARMLWLAAHRNCSRVYTPASKYAMHDFIRISLRINQWDFINVWLTRRMAIANKTCVSGKN